MACLTFNNFEANTRTLSARCIHLLSNDPLFQKFPPLYIILINFASLIINNQRIIGCKLKWLEQKGYGSKMFLISKCVMIDRTLKRYDNNKLSLIIMINKNIKILLIFRTVPDQDQALWMSLARYLVLQKMLFSIYR